MNCRVAPRLLLDRHIFRPEPLATPEQEDTINEAAGARNDRGRYAVGHGVFTQHPIGEWTRLEAARAVWRRIEVTVHQCSRTTPFPMLSRLRFQIRGNLKYDLIKTIFESAGAKLVLDDGPQVAPSRWWKCVVFAPNIEAELLAFLPRATPKKGQRLARLDGALKSKTEAPKIRSLPKIRDAVAFIEQWNRNESGVEATL